MRKYLYKLFCVDTLKTFQHAVLVKKIASKFVGAKEFSSPEALKQYLHDHPKSDKSKHRVKELVDYKTKKVKEPKKEESLSELMKKNPLKAPRKQPAKSKKEESLHSLMQKHQKKTKDQPKTEE